MNEEYLKELQKLYPDFKIPVNKFSDYYIRLAIEDNHELSKHLINLNNLSKQVESITKYKFSKFDEILNYIKTTFPNISDQPKELFETGYSLQEFNNYKTDKFYVSIDLKEANWQAFKKHLSLNLPSFTKWTEDIFNLHPAISSSKTFRQYIFGNTNPKRLQRLQEQLMHGFTLSLSVVLKEKIKRKNSDELVFEFDSILEYKNWENNINSLIDYYKINTSTEFKKTLYTVTEHTNFNEFVRVKVEYLDVFETISRKKLMSVPGHRFFLHFKKLILNKEIEERDTLFKNENYLAQWIQ